MLRIKSFVHKIFTLLSPAPFSTPSLTLLLILAFIFLSACNFFVLELEVKVSDIKALEVEAGKAAGVKTLTARLWVEVDGCQAAEDQSKRSPASLDLEKKVQKFYPSSRYEGCLVEEGDEGGDSYVQFAIPVSVISGSSSSELEQNSLALIVGDVVGDVEGDVGYEAISGVALGVLLPQGLLDKMEAEELKAEAEGELELAEVSFVLNLVNDTAEEYSFGLIGAYADGDPVYLDRGLTLEPYQDLEIELSDVSLDTAFLGILTPVLLKAD